MNLWTPEMIILSAAMHGPGPDGAKVFTGLINYLERLEPEEALHRADQVLGMTMEVGRQRLEAMMTFGSREFKSDFARRYYRRGEVDGEVKATRRTLLAVLVARGVDVPYEVEEAVEECVDLTRLESWVRRAALADSLGDIFDDSILEAEI